jgi:hypothetical protein
MMVGQISKAELAQLEGEIDTITRRGESLDPELAEHTYILETDATRLDEIISKLESCHRKTRIAESPLRLVSGS